MGYKGSSYNIPKIIFYLLKQDYTCMLVPYSEIVALSEEALQSCLAVHFRSEVPHTLGDCKSLKGQEQIHLFERVDTRRGYSSVILEVISESHPGCAGVFWTRLGMWWTKSRRFVWASQSLGDPLNP